MTKRVKNHLVQSVDSSKIYQKGFEEISRLLESSNISGCSMISNRIITFASLIEDKNGVLVGEILESCFTEIEDINKSYVIPDDKKASLLTILKSNLQKIASNFKDDNIIELYNSLREMRSTTTNFQLTSFVNLERRKGGYTEVPW